MLLLASVFLGTGLMSIDCAEIVVKILLRSRIKEWKLVKKIF
ncbi:hypothetical protein CcarbDRAFT_0688 [Clostridium carboxidivorans P7]|uniref:Uncharacterized protein n=1 Tax=Clostridium carboxidivorans P7 TaxID=536227 RepID=C6PPH1_9CLOT|nr:hypothetical protein CcarbDRAFT_0688 [Clostridium carboxidivorans P7]